MQGDSRITIDYYTDMLCVWAYFGQVKVDELEREFGERIEIRHRYLPLFGCCETRIGQGEGGWEGYADHVLETARNFPHVEVNPRIWRAVRPASSLPVHLVLKAVQGLSGLPAGTAERLAWNLRLGFFRDLQNIADQRVLHDHLVALEIPVEAVEQEIATGRAFAALARDMERARAQGVEGSPTFLMNEGRQRLYGNVGYRAIAANVQELLERKVDIPSWC